MANLEAVGDRLTILVVEDDPVYSQFVAGALREAGHHAEVASTGARARELATSMRPDAVVLDLHLPDETGFEIARALRRDILPESAIIILLTASLHPERDVAEASGSISC